MASARCGSPLGKGTVVVERLRQHLHEQADGPGRQRAPVRESHRWRLGPGAHVIFDDMHQGARSSTTRTPSSGPAPARDLLVDHRRSGSSGCSRTRLRAAAPRLRRRRELGFIRSIGNFFARADRPEAHRRAAVAQLLQRLPPQSRLADERRTGLALAARLSRRSRRNSSALEALHARLAAGRSTSIELHNRLHHIRKQVL